MRLLRREELPTRLWATLFLAAGIAVTGAMLLAYAFHGLKGLELSTIDSRFALRGSEGAPAELAVVQIDDVTFSDLREQWPFPRSLHGRLIDRLDEAGARVIAYDVQFTEPTSPREDNALIDAVRRAGTVVLATTEVDARGHTNVFGGDEVLRSIGARAGNAAVPPDGGGVLRRLPYSVDGLVSFGVAAAEQARGREIAPRPTTWIDFRGPPGTFHTYSFSKVLDGRFPRDAFRGKVVVVGPSAPTLQDVHPTSTTGDELMSGAEVQANAVWTALHGFPLGSAPRPLSVVLIVLLGLLAPIASLRLNLGGTVAVAITALLAYVLAVQLAFQAGVVLSFVYPLAALVLSTVCAVAAHYSVAAFERERTRDAFTRFVPEQVVDEVLARTGSGLRLGGRSVEGTVMFTDLRDFTLFAEPLPPDQVIEVVNHYLTQMTEVVLEHGGTLIDFMGDGFLTVFGAPLEQEDHADRALSAAREMVGVRLPQLNEWLRERGHERGFRMGIGLNSGTFVAGNVGSERRLDYKVVGDVVNTASRIQDLTKGAQHMLLLADSTRSALRSPPDDLVFVDEVEIRGRKDTVALWSLESLSDPVTEAPAAPAAPYGAGAR